MEAIKKALLVATAIVLGVCPVLTGCDKVGNQSISELPPGKDTKVELGQEEVYNKGISIKIDEPFIYTDKANDLELVFIKAKFTNNDKEDYQLDMFYNCKLKVDGVEKVYNLGSMKVAMLAKKLEFTNVSGSIKSGESAEGYIGFEYNTGWKNAEISFRPYSKETNDTITYTIEREGLEIKGDISEYTK